MTLKFNTNKANCNENQILKKNCATKKYFENTESKNNRKILELMPKIWKRLQMKQWSQYKAYKSQE